MNTRIKVSDLEVTKRGFPLLVYVEPKDVGYFSTKEKKLPFRLSTITCMPKVNLI